MAKSASHMGEGISIGLKIKKSAFVHPQTVLNRELIKQIVDEVRSHTELKDIRFTSMQLSHNTIRAAHTDNNLEGVPSIAFGLGQYAGGRLRIAGAKQPCTFTKTQLCLMGSKPLRLANSTVTVGH